MFHLKKNYFNDFQKLGLFLSSRPKSAESISGSRDLIAAQLDAAKQFRYLKREEKLAIIEHFWKQCLHQGQPAPARLTQYGIDRILATAHTFTHLNLIFK